MAPLETISFRARATGPELYLRVKFDGQEIFSRELPKEFIEIKHEFDDAIEINHVLEIEMYGKTPRHTRLNESGEIIEDRWVEVSDVEISGVVLGHMLVETVVYEHDTNGTTEKRQDKFFGIMGCNGIVRLEFSSPVYLWLLEHM